MKKTVAIVADLHCGHEAGLTPPVHMVNSGTERSNAILKLERQEWDAWIGMVRRAGPIDIAIVNGDCIDGRGERSGGTELITTDRMEQCEIAIAALKTLKAKKYFFTYGTPYHASGTGEDFENIIANEFGGDINSHQFIDVNGLVFDVKHKIGGSQVPHGRHTSVARDRLWNALWAEEGGQPHAGIIIRSHVHYYSFCGSSRWLALTTPALQAAHTKYGARQCSGTVDFGIVVFTVQDKEHWTWRADTVPLAAVKVKATKA